jgi:hypothetical protein
MRRKSNVSKMKQAPQQKPKKYSPLARDRLGSPLYFTLLLYFQDLVSANSVASGATSNILDFSLE